MGASSTLQIILSLVDNASSALAGVSDSTKKSLESIKSQAADVSESFGLMGAAILAPLTLMVKAAADSATADMQLTTAVQAGIDTANVRQLRCYPKLCSALAETFWRSRTVRN